MRSAILPIQASDHSYYYLPTFGIISCPSAFGHKAAFFPKRPAGRPSIALLPLVEPVQHVSDFLPRALMTFLAISRPLIVAVREFSPGALCAGSSRRRSKADTNYDRHGGRDRQRRSKVRVSGNGRTREAERNPDERTITLSTPKATRIKSLVSRAPAMASFLANAIVS
jgi:hypothetical protein